MFRVTSQQNNNKKEKEEKENEDLDFNNDMQNLERENLNEVK